MTQNPTVTPCDVTCSTDTSTTAQCGCASTQTARRTKIAKYGAGLIALCAACCAIPMALLTLGFVSVVTASYLTTGLGVGLFVLVVVVGLLMLVKYRRVNC